MFVILEFWGKSVKAIPRKKNQQFQRNECQKMISQHCNDLPKNDIFH